MLYKPTFILFLLWNLSFSQLSVRNDTAIFINDEILFVEDDIKLSESNSRIYLRNEAQIKQGNGTTGNSGIGELSLYQEGTVGAYHYNLWCSPIGSKTSNTTNNPFGISFLNDVIDLTNCTPAGHIEPSNHNGTSTPLNIDISWIWKFIASTDFSSWISVRDNTTLNPGEGFTMKGGIGSNAQRYDFRGKPNNGTIATNVLLDNYTLTGNPYPSALDAKAYIHDPENKAVITGVLFFLEQNESINSHNLRDYQNGYATYTIAPTNVKTFIHAVFNTYNGDGSLNATNAGIGVKEAHRYIPIGQGFMVEGIANGTVKAKNSHRVYVKETAGNSEFFKNVNTKKSSQNGSTTDSDFYIIPNDHKRFRLNIDFNDTYTRQLVETFHHTTTKGFDYGFEIKINPAELLSSDAYLKTENDISYLAEALPFSTDLKMGLVINVVNDNTPIRVRIVDIQHFESDQPIYIHDLENDIYLNLKDQNYNTTLNAGKYTDRFEITFSKNNTLSTNKYVFDGLSVIQDNKHSEVIIANPNNLKVSSFDLFDILGKQVYKKTKMPFQSKYTYPTNTLNNGIYVAKITLENKHVYTKKIVISNKNN